MSDTWIFGYGSLLWRPGFSFLECMPGWLDGWERRFWQGSPDHRGTPERPGRVVTLAPGERVWGLAFRLDAKTQRQTLQQLDAREVAGYQRLTAAIRGADRSVDAVAWVATSDNPDWLGPASVDTMAHQVIGARGASGTNVDYVLSLAEVLVGSRIRDPHVEALAARVRQLTA